MGKGSIRRPFNREKWEDGWDKVFRKNVPSLSAVSPTEPQRTEVAQNLFLLGVKNVQR